VPAAHGAAAKRAATAVVAVVAVATVGAANAPAAVTVVAVVAVVAANGPAAVTAAVHRLAKRPLLPTTSAMALAATTRSRSERPAISSKRNPLSPRRKRVSF
jgi:hypothetical protein